MPINRTRVSVSLAAIVFLAPSLLRAQVAIPQKDEWKLHNGSSIRGRAYDFGYHLCFLQRRSGKLLLNGKQIADPASSMLLKRLCDEQGLPLDDTKVLQQILSKQPFAQVVLPYYTIKYHADSGQDKECPTILLAADELHLLRPVFESWRAAKIREHEEQVRRAQEVRNQQAMLAMQAQALQIQQDMANAEWANARANQRQADELARIRSQLE
jgi:hypothetical protein